MFMEALGLMNTYGSNCLQIILFLSIECERNDLYRLLLHYIDYTSPGYTYDNVMCLAYVFSVIIIILKGV